MKEQLKTKAIGALFWSFIQEVALRGLQFGISVLLARLLLPEQFGVVAMIAVFTGLAQTLVDSGFASALIQSKEPTQLHKSSIFYFNILGSVLLAGVLCLAAPWIAAFYHQPVLSPILRVLSLLPVINGFGLVQNTLMVRHLEVKRQTLILASSTGASGIVALIMAFRGCGVWSLVGQQLAQSVVRSILLWMSSTWRPGWLFSFQALGEMFRFGWGMLCSSIVASVYDNLYPLLIGKFFSATNLGFYNRAQSLQTIASQSLGAIANRVTFPVFSALQDDRVRLRSGVRKAMATITLVQFPMMVGLAVVARPLILVVFTEKWASCIPYLQVLAFVGMLYPIHVLNLNVLIALGRSDLFFRLEMINVGLFLTSGLLSFHWGLMAMVWAQLANGLMAYFVTSYYSKKLINYSIWDQVRDFYPCFLASILMGLAVTVVATLLPAGNLLQLICRVAFGALTYILICFGMRLPAFNELTGMVLRRSTKTADTVA